MKLKLPKEFAGRIEIQQHLRALSFAEKIIFWFIDTKYRTCVNLQSWLKKSVNDFDAKPLVVEANILPEDTNRIKVKKALSFVRSKITYTGDIAVWDASDKWQTPKQTWELKTGDCEDGAILLYSILSEAGVPDIQARIVAGDVVGGGHAYYVWLSDEDGLEYPIDWCYWPSRSATMSTPYVQRNEYFYSHLEWFSFNKEQAYKMEEKTMVEKKVDVSSNFSWAGWDWKKWLGGNKEAAKLVISALFALWVPASPEFKVLSGAILKLVLDSFDYWVSAVDN